jgi:SAM-dependent methyltransferase
LINEKLDEFFRDFSAGVVVDLGGSNSNDIKFFDFPKHKAQKWLVVNISEATFPDVIGSIYDTGLETSSVDVVICLEVFEHLDDPLAAMKEIERILKPGGVFIGSTPFLFKFHKDPDDFFRYTKSALEKVLFKNFAKIEIFQMGGGVGTIGLMLTQAKNDFKSIRRFVRYIARLMMLMDYKKGPERQDSLTTGYIWRCTL